MTEERIIEVNGVTVVPHQQYPGNYPAAQCRKTGLPMLSGGGRLSWPGGDLYSYTQRKKAKHPVRPEEKPVAWYLVQHGYVPLYEKWKE